MIHTATETLKFKRLVRRLRPVLGKDCPVDPVTVVVGLLERFWHLAIRECRDGCLAKFTNEDIAELVGWTGDPDTLIQALIDERWIDLVESASDRPNVVGDGCTECSSGKDCSRDGCGHDTAAGTVAECVSIPRRVAECVSIARRVMYVHDWNEHKPNFLKAIDARKSGRRSVDAVPSADQSGSESDLAGSVPSDPFFEPSSVPSTQLGSEPSNEPGCSPGSEPSSVPSTVLPNLTKPNQTQPDLTKQNPNTAAAALAAAAVFDLDRLADTPELRESARQAATKLDKAAGRVLGREFIWSVAWISEAVVPGFCADMVVKLKSGGVKQWRRYIDRALAGELEKVHTSFAQCVQFVPKLGKPVVSEPQALAKGS